MSEIISQHADMEVVREVVGPLDLLLAVKETRADAVIVAVRGSEEPGVFSHLLAEYPHLTILGVGQEGKMAFVEQLCPLRREILEPSAASMVRALRQAVQAPCTRQGAPDQQK